MVHGYLLYTTNIIAERRRSVSQLYLLYWQIVINCIQLIVVYRYTVIYSTQLYNK